MFLMLVETLLLPKADFSSGQVSQIYEVILSLLANDNCFEGNSELLEDVSKSHQSKKYYLDESRVIGAGRALVCLQIFPRDFRRGLDQIEQVHPNHAD